MVSYGADRVFALIRLAGIALPLGIDAFVQICRKCPLEPVSRIVYGEKTSGLRNC